MPDLLAPGSAGFGQFRVDPATGEVYYDPQGNGGGWPEGVTETTLAVLVRDVAGAFATGSVSVDVTRPSGFDRAALPGLRLLHEVGHPSNLTSGGEIVRLADLSGRGAETDQAAAVRLPWSADVKDGLAGAFAGPFQGYSTPLDTTGPAYPTQSIILVADLDNRVSNRTMRYLWDQSVGSAGWGCRVRADNGLLELFARSDGSTNAWGIYSGQPQEGVSGLPASGRFVLQVDLEADGVRIYRNGELLIHLARSVSYITPSTGSLVLCNDVEFTDGMFGYLHEAALTSPALGASPRAAYTADLMERWGIA